MCLQVVRLSSTLLIDVFAVEINKSYYKLLAPAFNIADSAISIGVEMIIDSVREYQAERKK